MVPQNASAQSVRAPGTRHDHCRFGVTALRRRSAVVLMSKANARRLGVEWLAERGVPALIAGPGTSILFQSAQAITKALAKDGELNLREFDLIEINIAFAQRCPCLGDQLGIDTDRINIHGGATVLCHPVGMFVARLALSLAYSLKHRGGGIGAVALRGGGGQRNAVKCATSSPPPARDRETSAGTENPDAHQSP